MMKTRNIIYWAAAVLMMSGCAGTLKTEDSPFLEMKFELEYPGYRTKATGSGFGPGDIAGLFMTEYVGGEPSRLMSSGNVVNNARLTFDGAAWHSRPILWWNIDTRYDVYGYYPYASPSSVDEYCFSVMENQAAPRTGTELGGYEASDFLWAKASGVSYPQKVRLQFSHRMSRILINLVKGSDFDGELPDDIVVRVHNVVTDAVIDLGTGIVVKDSRATAHSITACRESVGRYAAIVVPQNMLHRQPLVEVITGGTSYMLDGRIDFKSGIGYTINVTLSSDPSKIQMKIGGEISGWK